MKKFKRKKVDRFTTQSLSSLMAEEMVENLYQDVVEKDLARIKYLLSKSIVKEEDVVDAVCFQYLEQKQSSTFIQILVDREVLYDEKYRALVEIPLETLPTVLMEKTISKKNIYLANMLVEYGVISKIEVNKYLQILQRLQQMGLDYDWVKFAENTKLISLDAVQAVVIRLKEKIETVEIKIKSTQKTLITAKRSLPFSAKLLILIFLVSLLIIPFSLLGVSSYKTIQDRNAPEKEEVIVLPKVKENITISEKVQIPQTKIDYKSHALQNGYKKWKDYFIQIKEWEELAQKYTPNTYIKANINLGYFEIKKSSDDIVFQGQLKAPIMPGELKLQINIKVVQMDFKIHNFPVFLDSDNKFLWKTKSIFSLGYHKIILEILPNQQKEFTQKFLSLDNKSWDFVLQIGMSEKIEAKVEQENHFINDFLAKLQNHIQTQEEKSIRNYLAQMGEKFDEVTKTFILMDTVVSRIKTFSNKNNSRKKFDQKQCLIDIYDLQIYMLSGNRKVISRKKNKCFVIPSE